MKNKTSAVKTANPFISFYGAHGISPVHQDVRNFKVHLMRREKLYRMLGLPVVAFNQRTILEIGPGGGYNALAFFAWGARVDFIEPNPKAQEELPQLLGKHHIKRDKWSLFPGKIEDFQSDRLYDIVIAEGFIPGLYDREKVINKISRLVKKGGVVVVTCVDDISFFFEITKRIIGHRLLNAFKVENFSQKIALLSRAFSTHFKSLKYTSRPLKDWIADTYLNPGIYGKFFSIADCISEFDKDFIMLGSSPAMFTDCSWYKNIEFDREGSLLKQFFVKRHILMLWDMEESTRTIGANKLLCSQIYDLRQYAGRIEARMDAGHVAGIIEKLKRIKCSISDIDGRARKAIDEAVVLLQDKKIDAAKIANAGMLASAFGRGQQYVSLSRKT